MPASNPTNEAARPVGLRGLADFVPGRWVDLALDINAFLRAEAGTTGDFRIVRLQISLPPVANAAVEFNAAAIMRNIPNLKRTIDFNAYDASGIDGVYSGDKKLSGDWHLTLEQLYETCGKDFFADITVRDRAGNRATQPVVVPLPPRD